MNHNVLLKLKHVSKLFRSQLKKSRFFYNHKFYGVFLGIAFSVNLWSNPEEFFRRVADSGDKEAYESLHTLGHEGNAEAQYYLGRIHESCTAVVHDGNSENDAEAFRWYLRAADQGHREANGRLVGMYDTLYASPYLAPQYETVNFENAGSATWNVPANIQTLHAQAIGGGGSGSLCQRHSKSISKVRKVKKEFYEKTTERVYVCKPTKTRVYKYIEDRIVGYDTKEVDYGGSDGYVKVEVPIKEPFFDWVEEDGTTWDWEDREVSKLVTREVNEPYVIIEHEDTPGKGGKAGEYKGAEFQNVRGGEAVSITVGMGGNDVNGSNTEISVGGQSLLCRGGNRGEVNGLAGEASGKWSGRGSGGSGQAHYQTPTDRKGKDGYVQITTLGLRPIDSAIPLEASVKSALEREAASSGYANYILGVLHEKGAPNLVADMQEAIRYYRLAVAKGDTSGQYRLGMIYLCGNAFVAKHLAEGVRLLTLSAQQGHLPAKCVLGLLYTLGEGVGKNEAQGISFFQQAATSGHMKAQYFLGLALFTGHGVAKNPVEAMNWLERSANQGHGDAQYWLAYGYEKGIGVPANRGKAIEWYDKAGKINHPLALFRGGCLEGNMDPDNL